MAAAAAVVGLWWLLPGIFLAAFLLISVFHFSGDPEGETPALFRMLYGGSVFLCPLVLQAGEVSEVFAYLAGVPDAQMIVAVLKWAAWPWVVAIGLAAIAGAKREPLRSVDLVFVAALLTVAPPLIGFSLFFCGMHSSRLVIRIRDHSNLGTLRLLLRITFWPMAIKVAGVAVAWWLFDRSPLAIRLAQLLLVGLDALTVPHMLQGYASFDNNGLCRTITPQLFRDHLPNFAPRDQ